MSSYQLLMLLNLSLLLSFLLWSLFLSLVYFLFLFTYLHLFTIALSSSFLSSLFGFSLSFLMYVHQRLSSLFLNTFFCSPFNLLMYLSLFSTALSSSFLSSLCGFNHPFSLRGHQPTFPSCNFPLPSLAEEGREGGRPRTRKAPQNKTTPPSVGSSISFIGYPNYFPLAGKLGYLFIITSANCAYTFTPLITNGCR